MTPIARSPRTFAVGTSSWGPNGTPMPMVGYSDGAKRQIFDNVAIGIWPDGRVRLEGLGQAYIEATKQRYAAWPTAVPQVG